VVALAGLMLQPRVCASKELARREAILLQQGGWLWVI
jgi:hypothetical protein